MNDALSECAVLSTMAPFQADSSRELDESNRLQTLVITIYTSYCKRQLSLSIEATSQHKVLHSDSMNVSVIYRGENRWKEHFNPGFFVP